MVEENVKRALSVWYEMQAETASGNAPENHAGEHLPEHVLYQLAVPGGLENGAAEDLEHLCLCAACQENWVQWLDSLEIVDDDGSLEEQGRIVAWGFLRAAAAALFSEPVNLESSCGRFELTIFPEIEQPSRGLVVLELKAAARNMAKSYCVVRDGTGSIILQGSLDDGRLAGRVEQLSRLDLKTWTVVAGGSRS